VHADPVELVGGTVNSAGVPVWEEDAAVRGARYGKGALVSAAEPSYKGFRYPKEIIAHAVSLYFRFSLSYRDVEELMLAGGVVVSYETVRQWCRKFEQTYAGGLGRRKPRLGDK
jgi:putative transposase